MPDILIRNVPTETVAKLKKRAKRHGRSLQAEALAALQAHGPYSGDAFADEVERLHASGKLNFNLDAVLAGLYEDRAR
jgi:plasmid stability protein